MPDLNRFDEMQRKVVEAARKALPLPIQRLIYRAVRGRLGKLVREPESELQAIFIHVPKNAGVSISRALFGMRVGHRRYKDIRLHEPELVDTCFVFAFVRNPWDRFLSTYKFFMQGGFNEDDERWASQNLSAWGSFQDFVLALENQEDAERILAHKHFRPQAYWLLDHRGKLQLDYVGRYESLQDHFEHVCARLGVGPSLPHLNRSDHRPYHEYYDDPTRRIIGNLYRQDISLFNYSFRSYEGNVNDER
jgi:hypothetical protein